MKSSSFVLLLLTACSGSSASGVPGPSGASGADGDPAGTTTSTSPAEPPSSGDPKKEEPAAPGDPKPGTTAPSTSATAKDCAAYATAFCTKVDACNHLFEKVVGAACEERIAGICEGHLSAPGTGYTKAGLAACTSAYATLSCKDALGDVQPAACAFKGTLALNSDCAFDDQCTTGACSASTVSCGKCVVPTKAAPSVTPVAELGEACDDAGKTAPQCNGPFGLTCDSKTKKCVDIPTAALGDSCGYFGMIVMCASGGTCKPGTTGSGTCVLEKAVGDACTGATAYNECAFGTGCISGKCAYPTAAAICK